MPSVDHSNIDSSPIAVKCGRKFGSALGGEVTSVCVGVCVHMYICVRTVCMCGCRHMYVPNAPNWLRKENKSWS